MFRQTEVNGFEADKYVTEQVFYPSKDGTKVPMFIVHRKVSVACLRSDWSECRVECDIPSLFMSSFPRLCKSLL